jgi:hypothetical protein
MRIRTDEQLELGMPKQIRNTSRKVRQDRTQRARWWFSKMRQVVDLALPAQPKTRARAEQTYLGLRQPSLF